MLFRKLLPLGLNLCLSASLFSCAQSLPQSTPKTDSTNSSSSTSAKDGAGTNAFLENPLRWQMISEQNGIRVYRDLEASPGRIGLRAKANVDASIAKVATAFTDLDVRKKWMNNLVEDRIVRPISDFERIEYARMRASFPYSYSDFIYKMTFSVLQDPIVLMIRMSSVNDNTVPVPADTVRGQVTNSYNFVRQIDADHSELVIEVGLDPKGAIPSWDSQKDVVQWFDHTMQAFKSTVEDPLFKVSKPVQNYIARHHINL